MLSAALSVHRAVLTASPGHFRIDVSLGLKNLDNGL